MAFRFLHLLLLLLLCSCANRRKEVVAEVDGREIYLEELSQKTKQEIFDLLNFSYDIKTRALDDLIKQKLLILEAGKREMTLEQYLKWYVASKSGLKKEIAVQDVQSVFEEDKRRNRVVQYLADSLYSQAQIKKYIYPPKQPECVIRDLPIHYRGNLKSPVSFIVASDFTCERCVEFEKTMQRIFNQYRQKVKFGYVNFSGSPTLASLACEAADSQNKFWEFHDALFKHEGRADSTFIFNIAATSGLDVKQFKRDIVSKTIYDQQIRIIDELVKRGLFATPTIIINDRLVYMTNSYEELTKLLNDELKNL